MNTKRENRKRNGIVRMAGGGALLMAMIGLILFSPLSASGQDGPRHRGECAPGVHQSVADRGGARLFRAGPGEGIEFFRIVLDLSDKQVEEIKPILEEHREKMAAIHGKGMERYRSERRMDRRHRDGDCDRVDRTEMRARERRERREFARDREKIRKAVDRDRADFDEKLAGVLDDGQMKKFRELRDLRDQRREERREMREDRREGRHGRRGGTL